MDFFKEGLLGGQGFKGFGRFVGIGISAGFFSQGKKNLKSNYRFRNKGFENAKKEVWKFLL